MKPAGQFSNSPVNFYLQKTQGAFCSRKSLLRDQERIAFEVEAYRNVLEANASIAKHSGVTLLSSRIEARVCELFSTSCPRVVEQIGNERQPAIDISWLDLLHERMYIKDFHQTPGGDYVCCFDDLVVEMSEGDRNLICSEFIWKLLHSPPDAADLATERSHRKLLTKDLGLLYRDCLKVTEHIQSIMPALGEDIHQWLDEVNATESDSEMTCEESSQELETVTGEKCVAQMTCFDFDPGVCENSLELVFNAPAAPLDRELRPTKASREKRGPFPQWTQREKAKMKRLLRQHSINLGHSWSKISMKALTDRELVLPYIEKQKDWV